MRAFRADSKGKAILPDEYDNGPCGRGNGAQCAACWLELVALALALGGFALIFLTGRNASRTYHGIWLTLSYVSNWLYAFGLVSADNPMGITWSLAIEVTFYLVWPFCVYFLSRGQLLKLAFLGIAAAFGLRRPVLSAPLPNHWLV